MVYRYILLIVFFCSAICIKAQPLVANAGSDKTLCPNTSAVLGGFPAASGGNAPYTYNWQPSDFLDNVSIANPTASSITTDITYTLTVTDSQGNVSDDVVTLFIDPIYYYNAGIDTGYCIGQQTGVTIGNSFNSTSNGYQYSWSPTTNLDNPTSPNPLATPTVETTYTLVISSVNCTDKISTVKVGFWPSPIVDAGRDTTIDEGNTITLNGSGAFTYSWTPTFAMQYQNTYNPDVSPIESTTYTLVGYNTFGCSATDSVVVTVIPGDNLFFYSAFTPNGDGINDVFYIGNISKYPDNVLKIYNRYGIVVYTATSYDNTWNGTYLGSELPSGTYFYTFDTKTDKGKFKGTVSILR